MMTRRQIAILVALGALFWLAAAAAIRLSPRGLTDPVRGAIGFLTAFPIGWLSVRVTRRLARLSREALVRGIALALVVAMLIDGAALRWAPGVYAADDTVIRFGSAWLLWGYGVSLGIALLMASRSERLHSSDPITPSGSRP
jgi:hypothetical protein